MAKRLATRYGRKRHRADRGKLDVRKTIRKPLRGGSVTRGFGRAATCDRSFSGGLAARDRYQERTSWQSFWRLGCGMACGVDRFYSLAHRLQTG